MKDEDFDISIEDFDAPGEVHEFSQKYLKEKEENKKKYLYKKASNRHISSLVAAAVTLLIAAPLIANAATHGEFFARVFGRLDREDIAYHEETVYDPNNGTFQTVVYPQQEFVDVDIDVAEDLIGDSLEDISRVVEIDGTTITIGSALRDRRAVIIDLTIEKEGGIDFLHYGQLDNETDGAWFNDNSTFTFEIGVGGKLYVDLERSTEEKLYCFYYTSLYDEFAMRIERLPCTRAQRDEIYRDYVNNEEEILRIQRETVNSNIYFSCENILSSVEFTNSDGGVISISPMSMCVDMNIGLDSTSSSGRIYSVVIHYSDGSSYIVEECNDTNHQCDLEIANYSYSFGSVGPKYNWIFNRLVIVDNIEYIEVNGVEYTRIGGNV